MSVETAKAYFERSDDSEATVGDVVDLFADDAVLKSPREGMFRGRDEVKQFYGLNAKFFAQGAHNMTEFYEDDDTVVCEGTIEGRRRRAELTKESGWSTSWISTTTTRSPRSGSISTTAPF